MVGITEQVAFSAGTTAVTAGLFACWKAYKRKRLLGCLIPKGKTYMEQNFVDSSKLIFFDIDGQISVQPLHKIEKAKLRLEVYPKARDELNKFAEKHPDKKIVVCSSDYELLKQLGLKKRTLAFIPSQSQIDTFKPEEKTIMERLAYQYQLEVSKKRQVKYASYEELGRRVYRAYKHL